MNLGLFLFPVLGGYWFLTRLYFTRYSALRDTGYHLFFSSAITGFGLGIAAHLLILVLDHGFPRITELWKPHVPSDYYAAAILTVVLGLVLPFVLNPFYGRDKAARRTAKITGSFIELLIAESHVRGKLIELSLKSGKSYIGSAIGFAIEGGMIRRGESDVALIPIASGYRDKDTQELKITTNYAPVIRKYHRR